MQFAIGLLAALCVCALSCTLSEAINMRHFGDHAKRSDLQLHKRRLERYDALVEDDKKKRRFDRFEGLMDDKRRFDRFDPDEKRRFDRFDDIDKRRFDRFESQFD